MRTLGLALGCLLMSACTPVPQVDQAADEKQSASSRAAEDPAIALANTLAGPGSPYRQGFSGSGDDLIHYVEAGRGQTVVFVHGFPSFWYVWRDQMEALRHCRRVIAIDAPGAGLSAKPMADEAYRIEALANRLDRLIAELAPGERVTLVGHDWGGALAWSYAQSNSSKLDRLTVFSAPPYNVLLDLLANDPEQQAASSYMPRLLKVDQEAASTGAFAASFYDLAYKRMIDTGVLSEREGQIFRQALAREGALYSGIQWYKANMRDFEDFDPKHLYWPGRNSSTDIPILLVRGSEDRTFIKRMEDIARREEPQLKVVELEGVGHWTPFQAPEAANAALLEFLLKDGEDCKSE